MNRKSPHGVSQNVVKREIPGNIEDKYTSESGHSQSQKRDISEDLSGEKTWLSGRVRKRGALSGEDKGLSCKGKRLKMGSLRFS